jgi:hypothetical protein
MISGKILASEVTGAVLGPTFVLGMREFVDKPMAESYLKAKAAGQSPTPPFLMKQAWNFGSPSFIVGMVGGGVALGLGAAGAYRDRPFHGAALNSGLITFGASAVTTSIFDGVFPSNEWAAAVAVDPGNPQTTISRRTLNIKPQTQSAAVAATAGL